MESMEYTRSPGGVHMDFVEATWSTHGVHMDFVEATWTPYGLHGYPWGSVTYRDFHMTGLLERLSRS